MVITNKSCTIEIMIMHYKTLRLTILNSATTCQQLSTVRFRKQYSIKIFSKLKHTCLLKKMSRISVH